MSENQNDHSEPQRPVPEGSRPEPAPPGGPDTNQPASASVFLVVAAWILALTSRKEAWEPGSYVSGAMVLAAIPMAIWGLRRAKYSRGKGKGTAWAGLVSAGLTIVVPISLLLYVKSQRDEAALAKEKSNFKWIALGQILHYDAMGSLTPTVYDPEKKQFNSGLSWRVQMLPYVERIGLYYQFNLKEPWDGPINRPLANNRVPPFVSPFDPPGTTQTRYHVFVGGGAMFDYGKPTLLKDIADGASNTIMIVEGREAAPWSKPFDLQYSPDRPLPPLGREDAKGFMVGMADGSVRFVRKEVSEATLRAAITAAGGDKLGSDW